MPRLQGNRYEPLYEAAQAWVDAALRGDGSLFTPGAEIWSQRWLDKLHRRFVEGSDEGSGGFWTKLGRQLGGADPAAVQLMAEMLFVHFLAVGRRGMRSTTKRESIDQVLSWSSEPVQLPRKLEAALHGFDWYLTTRHRFVAIRFLIRFARRWKALSGRERDKLLGDPWGSRRCSGKSRWLLRTCSVTRSFTWSIPTPSSRSQRARAKKK